MGLIAELECQLPGRPGGKPLPTSAAAQAARGLQSADCRWSRLHRDILHDMLEQLLLF